MSSDKKKEAKPDSLTLLALKRMGYLPGALVLIGFVLAYLKKTVGDKSELAHWIDVAAGSFVAAGLLWWLVRLFGKLFKNRPARGLFDGLLAGIVAGVVGGYFGYGWVDWWQVNDPLLDTIGSDMVDGRPHWVRIMLAFIFAVPIAGMLGLGCDLIHTDRKLNWRRNFSTVFLVGTGFLTAVGIGIFRLVPKVNVRGITFSEWLILFEVFVLVYPTLVAVSFGWKWKKIISRYVWIIGAIMLTRLVTYVWQTHDANSIAWAKEIHRAAANANSVTLWERQYCFETHGQDEFDLAIGVGGFCLWTIAVYALFYFNHTPAKALDQWIMRREVKRIGSHH